MPNSIGHQDLAALIARQPAVTERWRAHVRNSTFGTIHAATFSFPRSMGAAIPDPYFTQLASLDPRALEVTGSVPLHVPLDPVIVPQAYDFPEVDRRLKGDRLGVKKKPPAAREPAKQQPAAQPKAKEQARFPSAPESERPTPQAKSAQPEQNQVSTPKGDRQIPSAVIAADAALDRAGAAAAQLMRSAQTLASLPRKPVVVAAPTAPAKPQTPSAPVTGKARTAAPAAPRPGDEALRRAGAAEAHLAQASRALAGLARKPVAVAAQPAAEPDRSPPMTAPASEPLKSAPHEPATEIADVESGRAEVTAPIAPPAPEIQTAPAAPAVSEPERSIADKPPHRSDEQAIESLAQYAAPGPQTTRIFFGHHELGFGKGALKPWAPDEIPTVLAPPHVDTEIKRAALDPVPDAETEKPGETIAPKGEVTGEGKRPRTPAERLNLSGASRVKHEKCLANAIYFEARGEVERGQMAVAQVILNRAFSGYYPGNVCDVVYQNAHRHLACQFTFACDNHRDVVSDQKAWSVATRVASEALDGKFWLPEIGKATHYHATYVNPWWVRTMTKHSKLGIHIFYRPKRWGGGEEIPVWGDRLDATGSIGALSKPEPGKGGEEKRADAQPGVRRSIFDPVDEIKPGG